MSAQGTKSKLPRGNRTWIPILCGAVWLASAGAGIAMLWRVENAPGIRMSVPTHWPLVSRISRAPGMATLVMFAHPQCPCTRAGLGELQKIVERCGGRVRAHVIFYKPQGASDAWEHSDLWKSAAALPGVEVQCDEHGTEASLFGASTSGFVVLYDEQGQLCYNGGITSERGHSGDNEGESAIIAILNGQPPRLTAMPVFGCSLSRPGSVTLKGAAATCTR